jgi:FMN reductase
MAAVRPEFWILPVVDALGIVQVRQPTKFVGLVAIARPVWRRGVHRDVDRKERSEVMMAVRTEPASVVAHVKGRPLVVGLGGTLRDGSSTERALRYCLAEVERHGGRTMLFCGADLDLPMYAPHELARTPKAIALGDVLRQADAVVVASPGYHGAVSGLVKNALDYFEDLRGDSRAYLDNTPWGCISCAYGWQAAVGTLGQLRGIGHALRAWPWPTSLGVAINSADPIWDGAGELTDTNVRAQLGMLATQVLTFAQSNGRPR